MIAPNQRGYGRSSRPEPVADYDILHLCGDLAALLDHYGYDDAIFVGHDWGAIVVWNMAMLHPQRVTALANLSVPFLERGAADWVSVWEQALGGDFYIVHFNRQPGVADAVFDANVERSAAQPLPHAAVAPTAPRRSAARHGHDQPRANRRTRGRPLMSEAELEVFVDGFKHSGFTGPINWYRNFTRNWQTTADVRQQVDQPALMIHGKYDIVQASAKLAQFAPNSEVHTLECGHWIQQEQPEDTNRLMLDWLCAQLQSLKNPERRDRRRASAAPSESHQHHDCADQRTEDQRRRCQQRDEHAGAALVRIADVQVEVDRAADDEHHAENRGPRLRYQVCEREQTG